MSSKIFDLTKIDMDFEFELSFDGNLDLYINHKFIVSDVEKLIEDAISNMEVEVIEY